MHRLNALQGVALAYCLSAVGDGNRIEGSINEGVVSLQFERRWGDDCLNGCSYSHTWHFEVYQDCGVS